MSFLLTAAHSQVDNKLLRRALYEFVRPSASCVSREHAEEVLLTKGGDGTGVCRGVGLFGIFYATNNFLQ